MPIAHNRGLGLDKERALYRRLIISWHDLMDARPALAHLLSGDALLADEAVRDSLLTSLVVSYGRCFTQSRGQSQTASRLPDSFLKTLTTEELTLHRRLLQLRNTEFAHSDAEAAEVRVQAIPDFKSAVLLPSSRRLRSSSLSEVDLRVVSGLLGKMHIFIHDELVRLSPVLAPHGDF